MNFIKLLALMILVSGLYAFSNHRNMKKNVNGINIEFVGEQNLYITQGTVNKLLIQNFGSLDNVGKEKLVLNTIEEVIEANEMVKNAEVFLNVNGELITKIDQRKPIGRIEGSSKYYLDDQGKKMPFSNSHSARVPIITGDITGKGLEDAYEILKFINSDEFLRKNVIGIHIVGEDNYQLKFRLEQFVVNLGGIDELEVKFRKFKAFYSKADKDETLNEYAMVNLEYSNQVVCTKI